MNRVNEFGYLFEFTNQHKNPIKQEDVHAHKSDRIGGCSPTQQQDCCCE